MNRVQNQTSSDEIILPLDNEEWTPRTRSLFRWSQVLVGISLILQGVFRAPWDFFSMAFLIYGVILVVVMLFFPKLAKPLYLRLSEHGLDARISLGQKISLKWDQIAAVEAGMYEFNI